MHCGGLGGDCVERGTYMTRIQTDGDAALLLDGHCGGLLLLSSRVKIVGGRWNGGWKLCAKRRSGAKTHAVRMIFEAWRYRSSCGGAFLGELVVWYLFSRYFA